MKNFVFFNFHFFIKISSFIKHIFRKYFLWYDYWTNEKLCDRQERQNSHFKFTKENVKKINYLNQYLSNLMEEVYLDCLAVKAQHDKWILEGKSYYKNYEITGNIIYIGSDSENFGIRKRNFIDAQTDVTDNKVWCARFGNSDFCKTELTKENQFKNYMWWKNEFSAKLEEYGIENTCGFLNAFLFVNKTFSLQDFIKMTEENFCKNIEVNYVS